MQDLMMLLGGGIRLLPLTGCIAVLLIVIQYFNFRRMGNQFSDCTVRKGIVQEMGIREPTKTHPYRHCFVMCNFSNDNNLVEIPYDSGDLNHAQVGDEIPLYFYPSGIATVVAYNQKTIKKKFKQHVILIFIICVVLSFLMPVVGFIIMNRTPK